MKIRLFYIKFLFVGLLFLLWFIGINNIFSQDLMEQAFQTARTYDTIIDLWKTKEAVGNTILRENLSTEFNDNLWYGCFVWWQYLNVSDNKCKELWWDWDVNAINYAWKEPLIVRITKFLLRMTIVLAITMVLYNSIKYMIEVINGKDRKSTESKKNLIFVAVWIVVALLSVSIINLVISVPKSSIKTSDDLSSFEIWCQIDATIIAGSDLKKQVCEEVRWGERKEDRILNRCKIDWDRKNTSNDMVERACVENFGWRVVK